MAGYVRFVMNNSVSNTVIIEFPKRNESCCKLAGLTVTGVCCTVP